MSSFVSGAATDLASAATSFQPGVEHSGENVGAHFAQQTSSDHNLFGLGNVSLTAGRLQGTTMSGALTSERYNKLLTKMQKFAKDPNNNSNVLHHVLSLDKSVAPQVYFACIIVAVQSKLKPELAIGYQVLIIDGTNQPLTALEETTNNQTESISRFAEVVWDNDLRALVRERLRSLPGATEHNLFVAAPVVIGNETDPDNDQQVHHILANATLAASTTASRQAPGGQMNDVNLASLAAAKQLPELHINHATTDNWVAPDEVGNLARVSFTSTLTAGRQDKTRKFAPNSGKIAQNLMTVGTFTDLMPVMPVAQGGMNNYNMAQFMNPMMMNGQMQPLRPLTVISVVRSNFALTPAATELGIVLAADQVRTNRWAEDFRHKGNRLNTGVDFADIGAILVNQPDPNSPGNFMPELYASQPSFEDAHLWELLGRFVRPDALVAMDVETAGAASWYKGLYAAAALKVEGALQALHDSINTLTGGKYAELLANAPADAKSPFLDVVYYYERGFWRVGDTYLPLEMLDNYVAVCAFARERRQPGLVGEYVDTVTNANRSQLSRLNHRRRIIKEMSGGTAEFTRSVKRVIFNPKHRSLVNQSLNDAGIVFHTDDAVNFNFSAASGFAPGLAAYSGPGVNLSVAGQAIGNNAFQGNNYGF